MERVPYRPTLVIVVAALGFLVALAFNTTHGLAEVRPARGNDLVGVVRDLEGQRQELQDRLSDVRERMNDLEAEAAQDAGIEDSFTRELGDVRAAAGLTGVSGPGVIIKLADANEVAAGTDPSNYLIHDTDISSCVNALLAGGAEAVQINGERVVAGTPIRCAGTTVLVNALRLGSPYTITAIGPPEQLERFVLDDPGSSLLFTSYRSQYGLDVSLRQVQKLRVAAYRGSVRPRYLTVLGGGGS